MARTPIFLALSLAFWACQTDLNPGGFDDDGGTSGNADLTAACGAGCAAPTYCSKAGVGCIPQGTCGGDADCDTGKICSVPDGGADKVCVIGGKCGGMKIAAEAVPPNLLVVLDRSCSMKNMVGNKSKWEIAVGALNALTSSYKDRIRFGLTLFPDRTGADCAQDKIPIPVAPGKEAAIQALLTASLKTTDANYPDGPCVTNIDTGMQQAATDPSFNDTTRDSYALLVTDGAQSGCSVAGGDAGTLQIIKDLYGKRKVGTFVIGFGSGVDDAALKDFANAGGHPQSAQSPYYKAEDQATLDAAFKAIASKTLGCTFQLMKVPPDPKQIYVFFNKKDRVPNDPTMKTGWAYDAVKNQVVFYGASCADLRGGKVSAVDVVYGCDEPPLG